MSRSRLVYCALAAGVLAVLLLGSGCATVAEAGGNLCDHRCPVVQVPAKGGFWLGALLATPVALATYPWLHDECDGYGPILPLYVRGYAAACVVGGPPWLLCGWWWPQGGACHE